MHLMASAAPQLAGCDLTAAEIELFRVAHDFQIDAGAVVDKYGKCVFEFLPRLE